MGVMQDRRRIIEAQPHLVTASGNAVLVDIAEPKIERLTVTFSPIQTGSGTPSPSNVRPIMGYATIMASIGTMPVDISLGGTYYGGTVDLVSGVMTVTTVSETFRWGDRESAGNVGTDYSRGQIPLSYAPVGDTETNPGCLCNVCDYWLYKYKDESAHYFVSNEAQRFYLTLPITTSADTQIQLCYPLATPQTVTLTPQTIAALRGQQTVTSPAGAVEISYWTH